MTATADNGSSTQREQDSMSSRTADVVADGALVLGWHHSTRSDVAHCFDDGYPLCQDSDPGDIIGLFQSGRLIGRVCEDCRAVYKSRIMHAIRRAKAAAEDGVSRG